jgi:hypothetical protein
MLGIPAFQQKHKPWAGTEDAGRDETARHCARQTNRRPPRLSRAHGDDETIEPGHAGVLNRNRRRGKRGKNEDCRSRMTSVISARPRNLERFWHERAVRDKIKMLAEEPFGIPVVEAAAAYSSRFCAVTGVAGDRCEERARLDDYLRECLEKRAKRPAKPGQPSPEVFATLLQQFD